MENARVTLTVLERGTGSRPGARGGSGPVVVVANPTAGRRGAHRVAAAVEHFERLGLPVLLRQTRRRGDGEALARAALAESPAAVVAAGGDGTINEVINGLAGSGTPLGVLPLGTANVFAREVGLPGDPVLAAEVVARGRTDTVHLGRANGRHFLLMCGIGFDAEVVYELDLGLKALFGKLAYLATGLKVLMAPPRQRLTVEIEGERIEGYGAIIGKARHYGGPFQATPLAGLHLPELDVCVFTRRGALRTVRYVAGIVSGRHLELPDVVYRKARRLTITSSRPVHVQADGDVIGTTPMEFGVAENALTVLVPT